MPKFICSYAHDVACYADFVVEAKSKRAAQQTIRKALRDGKFQNAEARPWWENGVYQERVFVQGLADKLPPNTTLEELIGEAP